ncbi:MAG: NFACT RNA binding domain-containing protein [Ruthenibacterium sp.]
MALDAATIALTVAELALALGDAKIDKIFEPTRDEVVLNLRKRDGNARLFLSARSGSARVCLTQENFENPMTPPSFCMLLRKHFTGGRLIGVRTVADERIAFFDFQCTSEMGDTVQNTIAVELMGRYSNLVLVQNDKIIDALKRVDFEDSDIRQLLPGLPYVLPPKPEKLSFLTAQPAEIVAALAEKTLPVGDALMKIACGIGPVVCREAAFRAFGGRDVNAAQMTAEETAALTAAIAEIQTIYQSNPAPTAVLAPDGRPIEFSFLPLTQYLQAENGMQLVPYSGFSALLEGYYATKDKAERVRQKSRELNKTVHNLYERAVRKQAARKEEQAQGAASDYLRVYGELLSANLWAFERGAKSVTVNNYYDGQDVSIPLDVRLSPSGNAQKYFKDYKKKQTAAKMLTQFLADGEREVAYLETVLYEVGAAEGEQALGDIRAELKSEGYLKYYKSKDKKQKPADFFRYQSSDGFLILVGRNNLQNDKLTLKTARGRDIWFHVKNAPGSHAIVVGEGQAIPDSTKTEAAMLAAYHSSQSAGVKVQVDYTEVKNVRKTGDLKPGMVLYDPYETAVVTPDAALAEQLRMK